MNKFKYFEQTQISISHEMLNLSKFQWIWVNLNEIKTFRYKNNNNNNKKQQKQWEFVHIFKRKTIAMSWNRATWPMRSVHCLNTKWIEIIGQHRKSNNLSGQCALHNIFIHLYVCVCVFYRCFCEVYYFKWDCSIELVGGIVQGKFDLC